RRRRDHSQQREGGREGKAGSSHGGSSWSVPWFQHGGAAAASPAPAHLPPPAPHSPFPLSPASHPPTGREGVFKDKSKAVSLLSRRQGVRWERRVGEVRGAGRRAWT